MFHMNRGCSDEYTRDILNCVIQREKMQRVFEPMYGYGKVKLTLAPL